MHYTRLERPAREKYSSLFGPFLSYNNTKICEYSPRNKRVFALDKPFQPIILFANKARSLPRVEHPKGSGLTNKY
jgi:hypothetical protein